MTRCLFELLITLYTTSLSSLCRRIYSYWTFKILLKYSDECVRLNQFSQLSFMQYMGLCVFSLPVSLMMIVRKYVFYLTVILKSEVGTVCYCLGLGHEAMACAVCLSIFLRMVAISASGEIMCKFVSYEYFRNLICKILLCLAVISWNGHCFLHILWWIYKYMDIVHNELTGRFVYMPANGRAFSNIYVTDIWFYTYVYQSIS